MQEATEKMLKDWLTSEDTLKIIGVIDEVRYFFLLSAGEGRISGHLEMRSWRAVE